MSALPPVDAYLSGPCRPETFSLACALAGLPAPSTSTEAQSFAERCLAAAKVKAELLQKALSPASLPHAEALQLVAKGLRFASWQQMTLFAKRACLVPPTGICDLWNAHFFTAALWRLEDLDSPEPLIQAVATTFKQALRDCDRVCPDQSDSLVQACFLASHRRLPSLAPWTWVSCLDRADEFESIPEPDKMWDHHLQPLTPGAYRTWLHRDDPSGFAVWDKLLTPQMWRLLADALNHFQAFEQFIDDPYDRFVIDSEPAKISGRRLVPWFQSSMCALDYMPVPFRLITDRRLNVLDILDQMEHCDRLCALLAPLHDPASEESTRIVAYYCHGNRQALRYLRQLYSSMIGMVYAYRNLPWAAIAPFEQLPNARAIISAEDIALTCETIYFVRDVGIRIDDNGARVDFDDVQPWVDRFFRTPGWSFGYSVELPVRPFSRPNFVKAYATHLRKAATCFDPTDAANMEVIEKLRYGNPYDRSGKKVYAEIDAPATHLMLTKRAEYLEAIAATVDEPLPLSAGDFRPAREPLPLSIFDRISKKLTAPRCCTCGFRKLANGAP